MTDSKLSTTPNTQRASTEQTDVNPLHSSSSKSDSWLWTIGIVLLSVLIIPVAIISFLLYKKYKPVCTKNAQQEQGDQPHKQCTEGHERAPLFYLDPQAPIKTTAV